jgi:hypothetical protein
VIDNYYSPIFITCSAILEQMALRHVDMWLSQTFEMELPSSCVGLSVSDSFWNRYKAPSLVSMQFYETK